ncbi:MAG: hypothetical protein U0169_27740 [Polyangiaceae bacterium]
MSAFPLDSTFRRPVSRGTALVVAALATTACSNSPSGAAVDAGFDSPVGVNDVKKACEIRTAWSGKGDEDCLDCQSYTLTPLCPCIHDPDLGKCADFGQDRAKEADCTTPLSDCIVGCDGDCTCLDGCYAGHETCRAKSAARDGCVAEVCGTRCSRGS